MNNIKKNQINLVASKFSASVNIRKGETETKFQK